MSNYLYLFLDEGGNLDFSPSGNRFFTMTCLTKKRPFTAYKSLYELKYDFVEQGICLDRFHATEDRQQVRNLVFAIIQKYLSGTQVDSIIVEKRKTAPHLQAAEHFYPHMLGYLLREIINGRKIETFEEVIVFTDSLPLRKKEQAIKKGIKETLRHMLPPAVKYQIHHHASASNMDLQIADYFNWAIYRKWNNGDERSYNFIRPAIGAEIDIFCGESILYY